MMYFSRVKIDANAEPEDLFRMIRENVYASHQLIWRLFPNSPNAKRDFLFRQEFEMEQLPSPQSRRGLPIFYVVSERQPMPVPRLLSVESKRYDPKITKGMHLAFEIRVNPVVQEKVQRKNVDDWIKRRRKEGLPDKEPTKLRRYHDILMDAKSRAKHEGIEDEATVRQRMESSVIDWFSMSGKKYGFVLADQPKPEVSGYRQERLRKRGNKEIRFSTVDLSGTLEVTDPDLFLTLLFSGLGHSRSFGCGMMMVRRL